MIEMNEKGVRLSASVARALRAFAYDGKLPELEHQRSVGIDGGDLCATDGHTALRFIQPLVADLDFRASRYNGRCFPRHLLDLWLGDKPRRAEELLGLSWDQLSSHRFPPVGRAEPTEGVLELGGVMLHPEYLSRLELVSIACRRARVPGVDKASEAIALPGALITQFSHELAPVTFEVGGPAWSSGTAHWARVTIMPIRWKANEAEARKATRQRVKAAKAPAASRKPKLAIALAEATAKGGAS